MIKRKIKCVECSHCKLENYNGSASRYYCTNPITVQDVGNIMIFRCVRGSTQITIKSSPVWCPKKKERLQNDKS